MNVLSEIQAALAARLALVTPALPTAWPNSVFDPPADAPYQEASFLPIRPGARNLKTAALYGGIYQVNVCYPSGTGSDAAEARARLIADAFDPDGDPIQYDGLTVRITRAPWWTEIDMRPGFYCLAVTIETETIA